MKTQTKKATLHGTAVAFEGAGGSSAVLLRGSSGSGKSDLAFRLLEKGAHLVSDDQVEVTRRDGRLFASAVGILRGMIEIRGVGLVKYPAAPSVVLRLVIDLTAREAVPRLPDWAAETDILGVSLPCLRLFAFDASAPLKVRKAMEIVHNRNLLAE